MQEGDFELDGYLLSKSAPVYVKALDPGVAGVRDQDTDNPVGDSTFFGTDYLSGPTWSLDLSVTGDSVSGALDSLGDLSRYWYNLDKRRSPGSLSVLRFMRGGSIRRVFGRPRQFSYDPHNLWPANRVAALATFKTAGPYVYADESRSLSLQLIPETTGGAVFPVVFPIRFESGGERQGMVSGGGTQPAPFTATFVAPNGVKDPYLRGDGWELKFLGDLPYDRSIAVDTRTMDVSLPAGVKLSRKARFSNARIAPGPTEIVFGGIDPSGTARCDISWHETLTSF